MTLRAVPPVEREFMRAEVTGDLIHLAADLTIVRLSEVEARALLEWLKEVCGDSATSR